MKLHELDTDLTELQRYYDMPDTERVVQQRAIKRCSSPSRS